MFLWVQDRMTLRQAVVVEYSNVALGTIPLEEARRRRLPSLVEWMWWLVEWGWGAPSWWWSHYPSLSLVGAWWNVGDARCRSSLSSLGHSLCFPGRSESRMVPLWRMAAVRCSVGGGVVVACVFVEVSIVEFLVRVIPSGSSFCSCCCCVVVPIPASLGVCGSFSSYWY